MSRSDGFAVMDVSTGIVNDPKFRKLQRSAPEHVAAAFTAYIAVVGESWKAGRRVSVEDAWPSVLPFDGATCDAMRSVGLLDQRGYLPVKAWNGWFGPARKRREATRERWRRANANRAAESTNDSESTASGPRGNGAVTGAIPSAPSAPSAPTGIQLGEKSGSGRRPSLVGNH